VADPTTVTAPVAAPSPTQAPGPTDALTSLAKSKKAYDAGSAVLTGRMNDIESLGRTQDKAFDAEESKLTPPKLETPPPPTVQSTNPQQVWASNAIAFAAIASAFTRTPLTTAFNAAAKALQGFHQGDLDAVNQATKTWEIASRNAVEIANFQQKAYDEAMAGIEKRRESSIRERTQDMTEVKAQMTALASSFRDDVMLASLQSNDWYKVQQVLDARQFHAQQLSENMPKVIKGKAEWEAVQQLHQSPEYLNATPGEKIKKTLDLVRQYDSSGAEKAAQQMVAKFDASVPGKAYQVAKVASDEIDAAANAPDIYTNPVSQIALIDKIIFAATGSVRPGMAQYAKLLGAQSISDVKDMALKRIPYHTVLGPQQIHNIVNLANDIRSGSADAYRAYLTSPENHDLALNLHMIDESGRLTDEASEPGGHSAPLQKDVAALKGATPAQKNAYMQFFDRRYGPGAAERVLGGQ
jgi:hypothetical protein